jgi:FKBP-type peptidyl-prolyl cis-trans isomerase
LKSAGRGSLNKAKLQMKLKQTSFFLAGLLSCGVMAQVNPPALNLLPAIVPTNTTPIEPPDKTQFSHALGIYYSQGVSNNMVGVMGLDLKTEIDMSVFMEAFSNVVSGASMPMNIEDLRKVLRQRDMYHTNMLDLATNKLLTMAPQNKIKSDKFMEDIAKTPGVTKLPSGVIYKVIKDGDGAKPLAVDAATLTFHATLVDNTEVWRIEHVSARVADPLLPPGIREVLLMMKAGSHWMVYLPYSQAFAEKPGIPDARLGFRVGPYSALIFDLEIESIQPRPNMPGMMPGMTPGMTPAPRGAAPTAGQPVTTSPQPAQPIATSPIVRVPSAAEMERGDKPRVLTDAEVEAARIEAAKRAPTNSP